MKTTILAALTVASLVTLTTAAHAQSQDGTETQIPRNQLPIGVPPSGNALDEGTETRLSPQQLGELLPWAKNSRMKLERVLSDIEGQPYVMQKDTLFRAIRDVVPLSQPKTTETLMRWVLTRSLKVVDVLNRSVSQHEIGAIDQQIRVMKRSIQFALQYYNDDFAYLSGKATGKSATDLPYAKFGVEYSKFLIQLTESVLDASAAYDIAVLSLAWLHVDLNRDQQRNRYGEAILDIARFLASIPENADNQLDAVSVQRMRLIRKQFQTTMRILDSRR